MATHRTFTRALVAGLIFIMFLTVFAANSQARDQAVQIKGGQEAPRFAYPWMVALVTMGSSPAEDTFCGGVLIAPSWVVTAAHCVKGVHDSDFRVILGLHNLRTDVGQERFVAYRGIYCYHRIDCNSDDGDIALIKVVYPFNIDTSTLPRVSSSVVPIGSFGKTMGWGLKVPSVPASQEQLLYEVDLPIVDRSTCDKAFKTAIPPAVCPQPDDYFDVTPNMICAGLAPASTPQQGKDACEGDSGGPLIVQESGQWKLVGITSWGAPCNCPAIYAVFTDVSKFKSWIDCILGGGQ